jgi:hypothetical protein
MEAPEVTPTWRSPIATGGFSDASETHPTIPYLLFESLWEQALVEAAAKLT